MEADLVQRNGISYEAIPAAGVHGVGVRSLPGNLWKQYKGWQRSRNIIRNYHPDMMLLTGGYVAVPMALAGKLAGKQRPRIFLYVPDIEPGLALKTLARIADTIALTVDESRDYFPESKKIAITGYPLRTDFMRVEKGTARKLLDLDPKIPVLLVMGGSKGARSINNALLSQLPALLNQMQIIHISGQTEWSMIENMIAGLPNELTPRYKAYRYIYEGIHMAYSAADLVVTRAGASTLGELPFFGLPAILVPYPYAWRYQYKNAQFLNQRGAGVILEDVELPGKMYSTIVEMVNNQSQLEQMRNNMLALAKPSAAQTIASLMSERVFKPSVRDRNHG
jgi:UDP-N-acetylglucosamine--N-acetylmuramyl-(pentapeptide) pyrophosphoryl-undecaprenol N-acetylglucosamine transferase